MRVGERPALVEGEWPIERRPLARASLSAEALSKIVSFDDCLSHCVTTADVISAAVGPGLGAFGARAAVIGLTDFRLRVEPVIGSAGVERIAALCARLALDTPMAIIETIRTGKPVGLRPLSGSLLEDPSLAELGAVRECTLPIPGPRGVIGGLWLFLGPHEPLPEAALLSVLVERLSAAIDRARLMESERRMR